MEHASPEEYDDHLETDTESLDEDEAALKQESSHTSPSTSSAVPGKDAQVVKPPSHLQKRRRVTRACDECRRKKIKCDGKQPCTHCTVYSYDCTYDQPSNRRRNPAPQYVENLEHRVHRAETLLHILIPNLDLNDPGIEAAVAQGWIPGAPGKGTPGAAQRAQLSQPGALLRPTTENGSDTSIESMLRAVAQLDMNENGGWDYHGHSSGLSFVRRMREQLGDLMGPEPRSSPFIKSRPISQVLDSPKSMAESPITGSDCPPASIHDLPPKAAAREICTHAVEDAAALLRIVHRPTFWASFDRLYMAAPDHYGNEDHKFLPLFYSAMALGHLFGKDERGSAPDHYENAIQQGFTYFKMARSLMDIADCRDLVSIQAVLFMMLFLQSSAKLSQCYAYIGVALRAALRMGLHRAHAANFNPVEAETRKRIFWIIRKMDIYVGTQLGLPQSLSDEDIDQDFPVEVDDEYVTTDGIMPMPDGQVSLMTAFNMHTRLVQILQKIMRHVYPIKTQSKNDKSYSVPFSAIREIESDLEEWKENLPPILNPCPAPERYTRVQQLLRLTYAHAQVMLYRPFLHFVAQDKQSKPVDGRSYACAASYINVSRNIIHIQSQMKQKGLLNGAFWFTQYAAFFAILSLVYFAAENPDNTATEGVMKDAIEGREALASMAQRSMAADRCTATLDVVFSRLPDWMRNGQQNPVTSKKRHFDSQAQQPSAPASRRSTDLAATTRSEGSEMLNRRTVTYPMPGPDGQAVGMTLTSHGQWAQTPASTVSPLTPKSTDLASASYLGFNQPTGPGAPGMQQYTMPPNNIMNPALADIRIMFPTADEPFGYPNQPLTTFENNQHDAKNGLYMNSPGYAAMDNTGPMIPPGSSSGGDDNMEAQFFSLAPYIDQRQQQQQQQQCRPMGYPPGTANYTNGQAISAPAGLANGGSWPPQHSMSGGDLTGNINVSDIFGGNEWNPMLMPGYQQ